MTNKYSNILLILQIIHWNLFVGRISNFHYLLRNRLLAEAVSGEGELCSDFLLALTYFSILDFEVYDA